MAKFLADWRNPVLVVTIAGTILFGSLWFSANKLNTAVIRVGDRVFTENDVIHELKVRAGKQVVEQMVTAALLEDYAQQQSVSVNDADVDQLLTFTKNQLLLNGQTIDDLLQSRGMSLPAYREELRAQALQVKLLLDPQTLQAAVETVAKDGKPPFAWPERYRYRILRFAAKDAALEAIDHLQSKDGEAEGLSEAMNMAEAKTPKIYIPGMMRQENTKLLSVLKQLSTGQCSPPIAAAKQGDMQLYDVIQVVEALPAVQPTYANSNIVVGQAIIQQDLQAGGKKYGLKWQQLQAAALEKIDLQFMSEDYDEVRKSFKETKMDNPQIKGLTTPAPTDITPSTSKSSAK